MMRLSPYPGLRPFQIEEHDLFFGREEQVDELLRRLRNTRFLAIVGPSGCGKSSLVRAGMMAALETGYLVTAGSEWRFAAMRPGRQPMRRLAEALVRSAGLAPADLDATLARDLIKHTLERGPRGLVEVLDGTPLPAGTNLLVLVDQFEEIFRFRREGDLDEANAFVALLLESAALQAHSVYVVITMRSDFFGDCAVFTGLPEAINKSQYLTPRLTREQRQAAIVGPARVFGGDVEPELVNRLLNDMGTDPDQLPVLQHLLMRMWTWRPGAATSGSARLVQPGEERPGDPGGERRTLTMHDYESVGGFANALSNHAEEAFAKLGEGQQRIAEILLRRLSERGPDNRDIRRPTPAGEVAALAGVSVDEVTQVADVFRAPDCSFLVPPWPEPIHPYTVLDISHESFLRQWGRLKGWIDAEAKSVDAYRFLEQTARHWKQRRAALWGTPNLELAVAWREEERPTVEWAKRYGGDFAAAMDFLTASEQAHRAEAARKEARRKASLRRLRRVAAGFAGLSLLLAAGIGYYLYDQVLDHAAYFNTFVKKKGVAEGYGPLTEKQRKARLISLKVVRQGRSGPVKFIEAVNANDGDRCDPRHKIGTILPFKQPDSPSHKECRWEFVRDARGDIAYELAFNQFRTFVWGLAYTPKTAELSELRRRAHFLDAHGRIAAVENSRAEMIEVTYSDPEEGYEILHAYLDRDGQPQPGRDLAYKLRLPFNDQGLPAALISLDKNDQLMNDAVGNAEYRMAYDALGNAIRGEAFDRHGNKVTITAGYQRAEYSYDDAGNLTEIRFYNARGGPALEKESGAHRIVYQYSPEGFLIAEVYFGTSNEPVEHAFFRYHNIKYTDFDKNGNPLSTSYYDVHEAATRDSAGCHSYHYAHNDYGQIVEHRCNNIDLGRLWPTNNQSGAHLTKTEYDSQGNEVKYAHFDVEGAKTENILGFHSMVIKRDKRGNIIERTHFSRNDEPVVISSGYHREVYGYDAFGYRTEARYFGANGERAFYLGEYHREAILYNSRGHPADFAYFGANDEPVKIGAGYHRLTIENDEQGNRTKEAFYDEQNVLVAIPGSHAISRVQFDDRGNMIEQRFFGSQQQPVPTNWGCTVWRAQYDDQSRRISGECFDASGMPAPFTEGYVRWDAKYDANGNLIEQVRTGVDGKLFSPPGSYARYTAVFDDRGRLVEEAHYGSGGGLQMQPKGYARVTIGYERDQEKEIAYYDEEGNLKLQDQLGWAKVVAQFDAQGNKTAAEFLGENGLLRMQENGFARWTQVFDHSGKLVEKAFYDAAGGPGYPKNENYSAHKARNEYTPSGQLSIQRFSGFDLSLGYNEMIVRYDKEGEAVEVSYMDEMGQPVQTEVLVKSVLPGSRAEIRGIRPGDVLLDYNDEPVRDFLSFIREREAEPADSPEGQLRIRRGEQILDVSIPHGKIGIQLQERAKHRSVPQGLTSRDGAVKRTNRISGAFPFRSW